jgi:hypothetical protein
MVKITWFLELAHNLILLEEHNISASQFISFFESQGGVPT